ncbi:AAA family ATPase [Capnocytophaga sputigena]|jgi:polynucleotide kinase|uniref:Polynucleotide kinase n=1 Tax=Capnocytophaga sputigena TaxID=1019 RepID=A0A2A3N2K8_CAPSP|nr:AAA family ATPase [Capnocytophaga sputigena]ATA80652.1 polynucleotide kinase [Capnocytophaga sputigena]PBN45967.1 polynucleotide kinase [Capnocytophaga sputigena]
MSKLLILVGAPGSGKSTFARYFLRTEDNWIRVNRDDFRLMQFGDSLMIPFYEERISKMVEASVLTLLKSDTNVIIDATNTSLRTIQDMIHTYTEYADISFKVFDLPVDELVKRCDKRYEETGKFISKSVVERNVANLKHTLEKFDFAPIPRKVQVATTSYATQDKNLPKAVICDLDGTLSLLNGRDPYNAATCDNDLLNEPVAAALKMAKQQGYQVILLSGREDKFREPTVRFLDKHQIGYDLLLMRTSNDFRKDNIIKRELFEGEIQGKYFVEFLLDDRNQVVDMWRKDLHLPCFQVNYGDF